MGSIPSESKSWSNVNVPWNAMQVALDESICQMSKCEYYVMAVTDFWMFLTVWNFYSEIFYSVSSAMTSKTQAKFGLVYYHIFIIGLLLLLFYFSD